MANSILYRGVYCYGVDRSGVVGGVLGLLDGQVADMNLHGIVSSMISAVNPPIPVIIRTSTGNVTNPDGTRSPRYASPVSVLGQVQELSIKDLQHTDGLNLNGTNRALYINGNINAGMRVSLKGGDVIIIAEGAPGIGIVGPTVWLVIAVPESWPDWCRAICTLQNDSSSVALLTALQTQTY